MCTMDMLDVSPHLLSLPNTSQNQQLGAYLAMALNLYKLILVIDRHPNDVVVTRHSRM